MLSLMELQLEAGHAVNFPWMPDPFSTGTSEKHVLPFHGVPMKSPHFRTLRWRPRADCDFEPPTPPLCGLKPGFRSSGKLQIQSRSSWYLKSHGSQAKSLVTGKRETLCPFLKRVERRTQGTTDLSASPCVWENHGTDPPRSYAEAHGG